MSIYDSKCRAPECESFAPPGLYCSVECAHGDRCEVGHLTIPRITCSKVRGHSAGYHRHNGHTWPAFLCSATADGRFCQLHKGHKGPHTRNDPDMPRLTLTWGASEPAPVTVPEQLPPDLCPRCGLEMGGRGYCTVRCRDGARGERAAAEASDRVHADCNDSKAGKLPLDLIDLDFIAEMGRQLQAGMVGTDRQPNDWRDLDPDVWVSKYRGALLRHLCKTGSTASGAMVDDDTGVSHWAGIAVNAMICWALSQSPPIQLCGDSFATHGGGTRACTLVKGHSAPCWGDAPAPDCGVFLGQEAGRVCRQPKGHAGDCGPGVLERCTYPKCNQHRELARDFCSDCLAGRTPEHRTRAF